METGSLLLSGPLLKVLITGGTQQAITSNKTGQEVVIVTEGSRVMQVL